MAGITTLLSLTDRAEVNSSDREWTIAVKGLMQDGKNPQSLTYKIIILRLTTAFALLRKNIIYCGKYIYSFDDHDTLSWDDSMAKSGQNGKSSKSSNNAEPRKTTSSVVVAAFISTAGEAGGGFGDSW